MHKIVLELTTPQRNRLLAMVQANLGYEREPYKLLADERVVLHKLLAAMGVRDV